MNILTCNSYAKINLFLRIVKKRDDGYHEIDTVFQLIDLYDCLVFEKDEDTRDITLSSSSSTLPLDEKNLVYQAAKNLMEQHNSPWGVHVAIEKKIPIAAGLGGGSSNAATTLLALNQLWELHLPKQTLHNLAGSLGADVPFFLYGPTAFATGIGDIITPLSPFKKMHIVLINPDIPVSSKWAYSNLGLTFTTDNRNMKNYFFTKEEFIYQDMFNDLEYSVIKKYSVIDEVKNALTREHADHVLMSGSGPTVFGIFADLKKAQAAYDNLSASKWTVFLTETITEKNKFS